jgi:hypothetical protein
VFRYGLPAHFAQTEGTVVMGFSRKHVVSLCAALSALAAALTPARAAAFCGFYVTGADTSLYANATMVVLMRDGTRTVLSMQNNYQGPPEAFALVIPVPTVLTQDQVKILPNDVFKHVDVLGAPRLVEYWEQDPCAPRPEFAFPQAASAGNDSAGTTGVTVEARFAVGEYDVVILSADDSSGLETWLHQNNYNVPNGASDVLASYVAGGSKFFVAKVDPTRVTFVNGQAALSPLRFYYDTSEFSLPVRLGLLNSQGTQDLIVNILAPSRYEVANYPNVTVPTNIRVQNSVRDSFPDFYEALFSQLMTKNPGAVVTEYAWDSGSCDPCPTPPLDQSDLATLGADVTQNLGAGNPNAYVNYVLTRLHYRYTKESLGQDLMFNAVGPLVGGRGIPDAQGKLDPTSDASNGPNTQIGGGGVNNFQGRYVILHAWPNALTCSTPQRGDWGDDWNNPNGSGAPSTQAAANTALTGTPPNSADLSLLLAESVAALGVTAKMPLDPLQATTGAAGTGQQAAAGGGAQTVAADGGTVLSPPKPSAASGCACQLSAGPTRPLSTGMSVIFGLSLLGWRSRRARRAILARHRP